MGASLLGDEDHCVGVALVSIVLNLLSVGAAYGLMTLVFLHGDGAGFFGFQHVHVVDAWVALFLFSVLFALSMDYQVFLMSRIKERYDQVGSTRGAAPLAWPQPRGSSRARL
jgi:putative drug exporter of the RND superfamily